MAAGPEMQAISATSAFLQEICKLADDYTMGAQQLQILLRLRIHGTIAQTELSKFTGVAPSSNNRNIAKLGQGSATAKGLGWVIDEPDRHDRRFHYVSLTPLGKTMVDKAAAQAAAYLA